MSGIFSKTAPPIPGVSKTAPAGPGVPKIPPTAPGVPKTAPSGVDPSALPNFPITDNIRYQVTAWQKVMFKVAQLELDKGKGGKQRNQAIQGELRKLDAFCLFLKDTIFEIDCRDTGRPIPPPPSSYTLSRLGAPKIPTALGGPKTAPSGVDPSALPNFPITENIRSQVTGWKKVMFKVAESQLEKGKGGKQRDQAIQGELRKLDAFCLFLKDTIFEIDCRDTGRPIPPPPSSYIISRFPTGKQPT